jgi:large subunit ribosomal protein L12
MEYVYSALVLHSAGKPIDEAHVTKVLQAAGVDANAARVKALVASLEGVNIEEAISKAAFAAPAAAAAPAGGPAAEKKEEKKKEPEVSEEEAAAGLGALFG